MDRPRESSYNEYLESNSITLEWTVRGLKALFESSKGDIKSKVTRSVKFGGGRWQILFYPNSGMAGDGGGYVSLYLSCEPTGEEKAAAVNGKWVRDGLYKFSFELRNVNKGTCFNTKEAVDHAFSHVTANWGWAQFAKREAVYYSPNTVRLQDAFLIICTITSSPSPPVPPCAVPRQSVPRDLLHAVGALLDDPAYSDVEFILPARSSGRRAKRIWANRKLISRAEYFDTMFNSGFSEGLPSRHSPTIGDADAPSELPNQVVMEEDDPNAQMTALGAGYLDDSDEEDGEMDEAESDMDADDFVPPTDSTKVLPESSDLVSAETVTETKADSDEATVTPHKPSSRSLQGAGSRKARVVVHDVAYATYKSFLYYLYTDSIVFAPLSSTFLVLGPPPHATASVPPSASSTSLSLALTNKPVDVLSAFRPQPAPTTAPQLDGPKTRKAWLNEWQLANPGRPGPCSAKAVYRLADKLDLHDLKSRAFQHIVKSLSTQNVPYEVFSSFSAQFEEVRKVEVDFFLAHWEEIKSSEAMRNIFQQIRLGRHPGFEEVWPCIVSNLFYKPSAVEGASGDGSGGSES